MRQIAVFAAVLAAGGVLLGASNPAHAGPAAVGVPAVASHSVVEEAGWRRYCRRYGCGPEVVLPGVEVIPAERKSFPERKWISTWTETCPPWWWCHRRVL